MDSPAHSKPSLAALYQASARLIKACAKPSLAINALLWIPIALIATLYAGGIVPGALASFSAESQGSISTTLGIYGSTFLAFALVFILGLLANAATSRLIWSVMAGKGLDWKQALASTARDRFAQVLLLALLEILSYLGLFLATALLATFLGSILPPGAELAASGILLAALCASMAWLNIKLSLSLPVLALRGISAPRAMAASGRLLRGSFWRVALVSALWYLGMASLLLALTLPLSWIAMAPFNEALREASFETLDGQGLALAMSRAYGRLGLGFGVYVWALGVLAGIIRQPFKVLLYASLDQDARAD